MAEAGGLGTAKRVLIGILVPLFGLGLALPARGGAAPGSPVHLEIDVPGENALIGDPAGLAFLAGRAIAGPERLEDFDVVFAIDTSRSTEAPSGKDIDGDGTVGRRGSRSILGRLGSLLHLPASDPDDSVLAAEVAAVRQLLEHLDPRSTRVGVVTFAGDLKPRSPDASTAVPLTSEYDRVREGLDQILAVGPWGETNMAAGVRRATIELLGTPSAYSERREAQRILIFVTDGRPNLPFPGQSLRRNAAAAIRQARMAGRVGVRVDTYAVGWRALREPIAPVEMARATGGTYTPVVHPGNLPEILEPAGFVEIERLEVENRTTGERAEYLIRGADGSFSALVPMQEGENRVRVVARATDGSARERTLTLRFLPDAPMPELSPRLLTQRNRLLETRLGRLHEESEEAADALRRRLEVGMEAEGEQGEASEPGRDLRIETAD